MSCHPEQQQFLARRPIGVLGPGNVYGSYRFLKKEPYPLGIYTITPENPCAVVLFIPGRWCNAGMWLAPENDFRVILARQGFSISTVDLLPAFCDEQDLYLSALGSYDALAAIKDITLTCEFVSAKPKPIFIIGYSLGAALAFLTDWPSSIRSYLAGMIMIDGGVRAHQTLTTLPFQYSSLLMQNPAWAPRFRELMLSGEGSKNAFLPQDPNVRCFLSGQNKWWPTVMVKQLTEFANYSGNRDVFRGDVIKHITCPILGLIAEKEERMGFHRTVVSAQETTSKNINICCFPNKSHASLMADLGERETISRVASWIKGVITSAIFS